MPGMVFRELVRGMFFLTPSARATRGIRKRALAYQAIGAALGEDLGRQPARVPATPGLDEDMLEWSFFMVLEHNTIVNGAVTEMTCALATGDFSKVPKAFDPKRDVMPRADAGPEQLAAFMDSVEAHLQRVEALPKLRGTPRHQHPVFGMLDAHGWHNMFGLHLQVHLIQARNLQQALQAGTRPASQTP